MSSNDFSAASATRLIDRSGSCRSGPLPARWRCHLRQLGASNGERRGEEQQDEAGKEESRHNRTRRPFSHRAPPGAGSTFPSARKRGRLVRTHEERFHPIDPGEVDVPVLRLELRLDLGVEPFAGEREFFSGDPFRRRRCRRRGRCASSSARDLWIQRCDAGSVTLNQGSCFAPR